MAFLTRPAAADSSSKDARLCHLLSGCVQAPSSLLFDFCVYVATWHLRPRRDSLARVACIDLDILNTFFYPTCLREMSAIGAIRTLGWHEN